MEKEKKTIKCSYAVLVIILFAALCFVTDYAIIERKMNKCSCPDCSASGNTNVVNDNTNKTIQFSDLVGSYKYVYDYKFGNEDKSSEYRLDLDDNGIFYYSFATPGCVSKIMGNYFIDDNKLYLNGTVSFGVDEHIGSNLNKQVFDITSDGNIRISSPESCDSEVVEPFVLNKTDDTYYLNNLNNFKQKIINAN